MLYITSVIVIKSIFYHVLHYNCFKKNFKFYLLLTVVMLSINSSLKF